MLVLITYDVRTDSPEGRRRLSKVAKMCCNYGQRVQNSVFECEVDASQFVIVKNKLLHLIKQEEDSLRFYNLGNKYQCKIEQFGAKQSYDPKGVLLL